MARLNLIPIKSGTAPRGPAGGSFARFETAASRNAQTAALQGASRRGGGSKKGHAGTVAGLRGARPRSVASVVGTPATPRGPTRVFPSVRLARARTSTPAPAPRRSLLNRVVGKARNAFG